MQSNFATTTKKHSDSNKTFSELTSSKCLIFFQILIDNIFAMFCGRIFQQTVDSLMYNNCAPLLANLSLMIRIRQTACRSCSWKM